MSLGIMNTHAYLLNPIGPNKTKSKEVNFRGKELLNADVQNKLDSIEKEIQTANKIVILTHNGPDDDAVGSSSALKNLISTKYPDKQVDVYLVNNIFKKYSCLEDLKSFKFIDRDTDINKIKENNYDLAIAVDCAEKSMMGRGEGLFESAKKTVEIDHHPENSGYADVNLICPDASAASQIVMLLANSMKANMNKNLASDIYMAIVGDTQGFRYMKKPEGVFEDATKLTGLGVDNRKIYCNSMDYLPKAAVNVYADMLKRIKYTDDGKVAYLVEDKTLNTKGIEKSELKNISNRIVSQVMPNIEDVKVAAKLTERQNYQDGSTNTGGSLRGNGVVVSGLAQKLGGGGHEYAAGFMVNKKSANQVLDQILDYFKTPGRLDNKES